MSWAAFYSSQYTHELRASLDLFLGGQRRALLDQYQIAVNLSRVFDTTDTTSPNILLTIIVQYGQIVQEQLLREDDPYGPSKPSCIFHLFSQERVPLLLH